MKYVMFNIDGIEIPVVFPEMIQHHQVVAPVVLSWSVPATPVSAGKLTVYTKLDDTTIVYEAHGESISLKLKSRPEDSGIITRFFEDF